MIFMGVDAGSRAIKVVLAGPDGALIDRGAADQGVDHAARARALAERLLAAHGATLRDVEATVATGYARAAIDFATARITEITCHARGVRAEAPAAASVIEIGGQDSKVLRLHPTGAVRDFAMNDRCAAGTGRFLEVAAQRLEVQLADLGQLARQSSAPAAISSMCVVFAETEIIGLLAGGAAAADIAAGIERSIATRVAALAGRMLADPVVFTGGVALVPGMREALQDALGRPIEVAPSPQFTGALGAALLAREDGER